MKPLNIDLISKRQVTEIEPTLPDKS